MKKILLGVIFLLPIIGFSQMVDVSKWTISNSKSEVKVGETIEIIFTVAIDKGWKLYSIGDTPPQASITVEGSGIQLVGNIKEGPGVHAEFDSILEMKVRYYVGHAEFRQKVKILKKNPVINIDVDGQACPIGPGQCIRVNKTFTVKDIKVVAGLPVEEKKGSQEQKEIRDQKNLVTENSNGTKGQGKTERLKELEKQKEELITKDAKGNDETVIDLKNFVNKYGRK